VLAPMKKHYCYFDEDGNEAKCAGAFSAKYYRHIIQNLSLQFKMTKTETHVKSKAGLYRHAITILIPEFDHKLKMQRL
jgi:hypothetical protein